MIIRETMETPVSHTCDVLVAGGGVAGIAAALAAARSGKKVTLIERGFMLGGLATAGLVTIYLPLCDGYGRQVSFGLAEELLRLSIAVEAPHTRGYDNWIANDDPARRTEHDRRFEVDFNPSLFAISAEKLLLKHGVRILYGVYAVAAIREGNRISAVIVESKSGRQAITAGSYVDATGDFDLGHFAGCPEKTFRQGNVLAAWYYAFGSRGVDLHMLGYADVPDEEKTDEERAAGGVVRYTGLDAGEISDFMIRAHEAEMADILRRRENDPTVVPVTIPTMPQLRMTRHIVGVTELSSADVHRPFADSIGMVSDWRKRGPVYEVPFSSLWSEAVVNLAAAGRCTSVTEGMWDIMRVIPCCAVTGEAAGVAAAMTDDFSALDVTELQAELRRRGVVLHESDLT